MLKSFLASLLARYIGSQPTSPAGEVNAVDRSGALRTAGLIFVLAGGAASLTYLGQNVTVLGIGTVAATALGYAAEFARRKWKDYQSALITPVEPAEPSEPFNPFAG